MATPKLSFEQFLQQNDPTRAAYSNWANAPEQFGQRAFQKAAWEEYQTEAKTAYDRYLMENPSEADYRSQLEKDRVEQDRQLMEQQIGGLKGVSDLRSMLESYAKNGYVPSEADLAQAEKVFSPRQVALEEAFRQQRIGNQQLAARLGRAANDPILAAKLAQEQTRQSGALSAEKAAYSATLPLERLQFAQQRAGLEAEQLGAVQGRQFNLSQLATQAQSMREQLALQREQAAFQRYQYEDSKPGWFAQGLSTIGGLAGAVGAGMGGYGTLLGALNNSRKPRIF